MFIKNKSLDVEKLLASLTKVNNKEILERYLKIVESAG